MPTPSFSFGYKESFSNFGVKEEPKEASLIKNTEDISSNLPSVHQAIQKEEPKKKAKLRKQIKDLKKEKKNPKISKEIRAHSTDRIRDCSPGPGFYQPNYVNMIDGPKIRYFSIKTLNKCN